VNCGDAYEIPKGGVYADYSKRKSQKKSRKEGGFTLLQKGPTFQKDLARRGGGQRQERHEHKKGGWKEKKKKEKVKNYGLQTPNARTQEKKFLTKTISREEVKLI